MKVVPKVYPDETYMELCLPAHLMTLMVEQTSKKGFALRMDVAHNMNVASVAPMSELDVFSIRRIAKRVDDVANTLLHGLAPEDPRDGLYACCVFCMVLVEEGLLTDKTNQAVLVAMLLLDDLKDERPDTEGQLAVWKMREKKWDQEARGMLLRANLQGLYLRV